MTGTWLDLKSPLDATLERLLRDLDQVLRTKAIPYVLTGGMAREILLHYGYGCAKGRVTNDVDFGVLMASWEGYGELKADLAGSERFRQDPKNTQRMFHLNPTNGTEIKVDLVPFGPIAGPEGELKWPPDGSHVMRVLGYAQAITTAVRLRLDDCCWIPLASAGGIAMTKLVAWLDNGEARHGRDAVDFIEVLRNHAYLLTDKELYEEYADAMDFFDFRADLAAAWVLGKNVSSMAPPQLMGAMRASMQIESRIRMINYFLRENFFMDPASSEVEVSGLLDAFEKGLTGNEP